MTYTSTRHALAPLRLIVTLLALFMAAPLTAQAQDAGTTTPETVDVGLYMSPPFVMEKDGHYTGMAIDLWEALAKARGIDYRYRPYKTISALLAATESGEVDVAVTNLTITQGRAERIDFTQPWFDAGMRIMVDRERDTSFGDLVTGLADAGFLRAYAWLALVIIVATFILTLFDRRFDPAFPKAWREGMAESFYSVMSVATTGRPPSRKNLFGWMGRIWQGIWLVCGIAVLAYVTSTVTSVMTTLSLTSEINTVEDLRGRDIGVFTGSVAEEFARREGLERHSYKDIEEAVAALKDGDLAAIIGDGPVLEYYSHTHPEANLDVVGPIFEPDKYGFGLTRRSQLTRPLTLEVLGLHERDFIEQLHTQYFGEDP